MAKRKKMVMKDEDQLRAEVASGVNRLQNALRLFQQEQGLDSILALAKRLGIPASNLNSYLPGKRSRFNPALPRSDGLEKLSQKLTTLTPEDKVVINQAYQSKCLLGSRRSRSTRRRPSVEATNLTVSKQVKSRMNMRQPTNNVAASKSQEVVIGCLTLTEESAQTLVARLHDRLVAWLEQRLCPAGCGPHEATIASSIETTPLVLTQENFRVIDATKIDPAVLNNWLRQGLCVLETARRFYNLLAQLEPEHTRHELLRSVTKSTNELVFAMAAARDAVPAEALEMIERQREVFGTI